MSFPPFILPSLAQKKSRLSCSGTRFNRLKTFVRMSTIWRETGLLYKLESLRTEGRAFRSGFLSPDVAVGRPVLEEPAVRRLVLPAHVAGVFPQQLHLVRGVSRVPQRVPQVLPGARGRLDGLFTGGHKVIEAHVQPSITGSFSFV